VTIEAEPTPLRRRSLALCLVAGFMTLLDGQHRQRRADLDPHRPRRK